MKKIETILFTFCVIFATIAAIWSIIPQWSWMINDTKVSFSDKWNMFLSGPIYFWAIAIIIRIVLILKYKR